MSKLILICYILFISKIKYVFSIGNISNIENTLCKNGDLCIMKCCPFGSFLQVIRNDLDEKERVCNNYNETKTATSLQVDGVGRFKYPNMSIFNVKAGIILEDDELRELSVNVIRLSDFNVFLTEGAEVHLQMPNAFDEWLYFKNNRFCWDYIIIKNKTQNTTYLEPGIWVLFDEDTNEPSETRVVFMTTAMLTSCFFLFVVLIVYALLPELRNLCGLILMAYVASQLGAFLLLAVIRIYNYHADTCLYLTLCIYFCFLASFCWLNVMSYDIWWTFRGYAKARPIHRRGERFKFAMYCLYAWGLPLAMTIGINILNNSDMSDMPGFVTPKIPADGCFIEGGEKYYYLYMPMLILILCNWMFYMMTAFNVWRLSRGTAVLDSAAAGTPQAHRTHRNRFMVYLKLSVVMGLNWVLEVASYKYPNDNLWIYFDFYNILIGVFIFLIFVCKPKIIKKLVKVFLRCKKAKWRPGKMNSTRSASSASDSGSSQETQTLQVCVNPKGPTQVINSF